MAAILTPENLGHRDSEAKKLNRLNHLDATSKDLVAAVKAQGLEGIIAKRIDSRYESGRSKRCMGQVQSEQRSGTSGLVAASELSQGS